jgi:predicted ATP-dependent endonuclease of OLD family
MALKLRQTGNERIVFSSQVILCEGTSDQAGIRALAEASHIELDENNVAIVDCDGRDNIPAYARFCSALGLKYLAVQDGDASKSAAQTGVEAVRRAVNESDLGALFEFPENIETSLGGVQKDSERVADAMRQSAKRSSVAPEITELIEILSTFVGNATQLG